MAAPLQYRLIRAVEAPKYRCMLLTFLETDLRGQAKVQRLEQELGQFAEGVTTERIVVDFRGVEMMPTAVLGILLLLVRQASEKGVKVRFCRMEANVRKAFELIAGRRLVDIHGDRKQALTTPWDRKWYWPF